MRDYDPTTGRYIQADPLGLVDGPSIYRYVGQNPGRYVDPRGEQSCRGPDRDECEQARERVRQAKDQGPGKRSCSAGPAISNLSKWLIWREECAARRQRDLICPTLPPRLPEKPNQTGERTARGNACNQATQRAIHMLFSVAKGGQ